MPLPLMVGMCLMLNTCGTWQPSPFSRPSQGTRKSPAPGHPRVPLAGTLGSHGLAQAGFFLRKHLVDESVLYCLLCGEEVVTVGILLDALHGLTRMTCQDVVDA